MLIIELGIILDCFVHNGYGDYYICPRRKILENAGY